MLVILSLFLPVCYEVLTFNFILWPIITLFIVALIMSIYRAFK